MRLSLMELLAIASFVVLLRPEVVAQNKPFDPSLTTYPPMLLNLNGTARTATTSGYAQAMGAQGRLYWTVDENIIISTNSYSVGPTPQCPPGNPQCEQPPLEFTFDISRYCDDEFHFISAMASNVATGGGSTQLAYQNPGGVFRCTGGGSSLPQPTDLPVIFVPGIMGSVMKGLYQGQTVQYWPNFSFTGNPSSTSAKNLTLDTSSPYYRTGIFASDAIRSVTIFNQPVASVYEPLLTNLSAMGFNPAYDVNRHFEQNLGCDYSLKNPDPTRPPNARLFVFPYDWRQDINVTAGVFRDYVKCVQDLYPPGTRVNVIAHSMGGLVVRKYILQQSSQPHRLGKVITMASPFLGAPDATYKLYTGGNLKDFALAVTPATIQFLASHFRSLHQLLPSRKYHLFRQGIIVERGDVDGNGIPNEKYDFDRIVQLINSDFPSTLPGSTGTTFHDFSGQDDWHNDTSSIKYFHVLGQQNQWNTTDGLYVSWSTRCRLTGNRLTGCFKNRRYVPKKGYGDQTVPLLSTEMGWAALVNSPGVDLAPPGMRIFVRNSLSPSTDSAAEHTGLTKDAKVRDLLAFFLGVGQLPALDTQLFEIFRPGTAQATRESVLTEATPSYYLTIAGQTEAAVRDGAGNTAAIENGFLRNDVPGLIVYEMIADDTVMLAFATKDTYTADFLAGTTPMEVELINGKGNQDPNSAVRYNNLDLPPNTKVRLTFSSVGGVELRIDANGDGTYETLIPATANLTGLAAKDVDPPIVGMTVFGGQGGTATVHINAQDNQSGVDKIWYSVDGLSFDRYTEPFTINLSSNPLTIEAFADDNAANRSGLVTRTVRLAPTVLPVVNCITVSSTGLRAWFGYENQTTASVTIPVGSGNEFYPPPSGRGQITTFQSGVVNNAFSVPMHRKKLEWRLLGTDGLWRIATASLNATPSCQ